MKRTTISLPDDLAALLSNEARRRGRSVSAITRAALMDHFGLAEGEPRELPFLALGGSGHSDTSERIEEILAEEWQPDRRR